MFNCSVKGLEREKRRGREDRGREKGRGREEKEREGKTYTAGLLGDLSSDTLNHGQENAVWMKGAREGEQRDSGVPRGFGWVAAEACPSEIHTCSLVFLELLVVDGMSFKNYKQINVSSVRHLELRGNSSLFFHDSFARRFQPA